MRSKIICSALLILCLLVVCSSYAEESESMSLEKLISLRAEIDEQIANAVYDVDRSSYSLDGLIYVSNGSEIRINTYEGSNNELIIPQEIDGVPVTMIQENAFKDNKKITSVVIPEGISVIPTEAFSGCSNLTSIVLPSTIKTIQRWAFLYANKLSSIVFPEGLTTLESAAFQRAEGLSGILVLPTTLTSKAGYTFSRCDKLTGVIVQSDIPLCDADFGYVKFVYIREGCEVTIEENPFQDGTLEVIIIPASVTSISDEAFSKCSKLTIVAPPGSYAERYAKNHFIVCDTEAYERMTKEYDEQYLNN